MCVPAAHGEHSRDPAPQTPVWTLRLWVSARWEQLSSTIPPKRELDKQKRRKSTKWRGRLLQRGHRLGVIGNKMSFPPHFLDLEQVIKSLCCLICPAYKMDQAFIRNCFVSLYHSAQQIFLFKMNFYLLTAAWASLMPKHPLLNKPRDGESRTNQTNTEKPNSLGQKGLICFLVKMRLAQGALCSLLRKWLILISGTQRRQTWLSEGCAPALLPGADVRGRSTGEMKITTPKTVPH